MVIGYLHGYPLKILEDFALQSFNCHQCDDGCFGDRGVRVVGW